MNTPKPPDRSVDRDARPLAERDWLAQERALSSAAVDRRDVLLARALRTMPASAPPADFAATVARLAASGVRDAGAESRLERVLLHVLLAAMALAGTGVVAMYGARWWALAGDLFGTQAAQWGVIAGLCLLLSWLPEGARRVLQTRHTRTPA